MCLYIYIWLTFIKLHGDITVLYVKRTRGRSVLPSDFAHFSSEKHSRQIMFRVYAKRWCDPGKPVSMVGP